MYQPPGQPLYDPINDPAPPGFNQEAWARRNKPIANFARPMMPQSGYMGPTALPNGGVPQPQVDPQRQQQEMVMQNAMAQARAMNLPMGNVQNPLQQPKSPMGYGFGNSLPTKQALFDKGIPQQLHKYYFGSGPQTPHRLGTFENAVRRYKFNPSAVRPDGTTNFLQGYGQPRAPNGFPSSYQSRAPAYQSAYRSPLS